ncbi:MAG: mechanosensitive ion channel family protein [Paracoccaceae bacterium]|nr:mechanosensitive ion channel family protein [Paracoccaceae bacterium]
MARLLWALRAALVLIALAAMPAAVPVAVQAQSAEQAKTPNYKTWESFATRAETTIAKPTTSNIELDFLRRQVVGWRSQFQDAQNANKARIATLQQQIAALGPVPAKDQTEAPEIATRRKELNDQLAKLQAPGLAADEAFSRADGIVREIDNVVRTRQAAALMHLGPSPVNPANWPAALNVLSGVASELWTEVSDAWSIATRRAEFASNVPLILGYLLVAGLLLWRGKRWVEQLSRRLSARVSDRGREVLMLIASLSEIAVPLLGVAALVGAVTSTAMIGPEAQRLLGVLMVMPTFLFTALWLGGQMFPQGEAPGVLDLPPERKAEGRLHAAFLGGLFALDILRRAILAGQGSETSLAAANAVLSFPVILLAGLALFRLARLMRVHGGHAGATVTEDERASYRDRLIALIGRAVMVVAIGAPVFGAIGYIAAARGAILPTVLSLALIGLLVVIHSFFDDLYRWIARIPEAEDGGLVPVAVGFTLTMLALPVFALVWGARTSDLAEVWSRFAQGFSVGSTRISPANFLTFAALFAIGYGATRLVQGALKTTVLPKTKIDLGGQNAIVAGLGYLGIVLSALIAITAAGIDLSGLAIVAGALSVGIGFGLQNIVSNFVSGVILLIERPVSEGDWIEAGGVQGTVRSISVRSTRIETFDRADVIVPNSNLITGTVTNMTKFSRVGRLIVPVGVAYGTDTRRVDRILREIAEGHPLVVLNPKPQVVFAGFGADSLDFEIRVILRDVNFILDVKTELNHQIAERFAKEKIEIPFAQRDIWLRNPEVLRGDPPPQPAASAPASGSGAAPSPDAPELKTPDADPDPVAEDK